MADRKQPQGAKAQMDQSSMGDLQIGIEVPVAYVKLNRPPLNVLDLKTIKALSLALDIAITEPGVGIIALSAAGEKAFSVGVDIKDHTPDKVGNMLDAFHSVFRKLIAAPQVSVAAVKGYCLGGGCELATFCDVVLADEGAKFGVPEIDVGCYPPVAAAFYPMLIGDKRANAMVLSGKPIGAAEAKAIGLITDVAPAGQLDALVSTWVDSLKSKSQSVLMLTRRAMKKQKEKQFLDALDWAEKLYLEELVKLDDMHEGLAAFLEKRKPVWRSLPR